ncbi:MAG: ATP-binding protein [Burkholderiaceae bacterium]
MSTAGGADIDIPAGPEPDDAVPGYGHGGAGTPESYWQALRWYSLSRVAVAALLWFAGASEIGSRWLEMGDVDTFQMVALCYLIVALAFLALIGPLRPNLQFQLFMQVATDLLVLTAFVHLTGGVRGGLGSLMIASVAAGSVLSSRRLAATFAAGATLLLLGETALRAATLGPDPSLIAQAGLIGGASFLTAMSVNWLASRLQAQEELVRRRGVDVRNQLAVTQRVIAELEQGVLVVRPDGRLRTMNRAAQLLLGVDPGTSSEDKAPRLREMLPAGWSELIDQYARWRRESAGEPGEFSFEYRGEDGRDERGRIRVRMMSALADGHSDAMLLIESLRELEQRAQQLKLASMGRLSASIAHEIRNPLGAIRHANSLLAEQIDSVPLARLTKIVEDNTVRINRVIEDVLSISRGEKAVDETVDMQAFLTSFLPEFTVQSGADRRRIRLVLESDAPIRFDSGQLRQVLVNLVGNALRYASQEPGAVMVRWRKLDDERLELSVADDGPGLGSDAMQHAFEPFFTTESRGTGLGLYLSRELCTLNGAAIRYQPLRSADRYGGAFVIEPRRVVAGGG